MDKKKIVFLAALLHDIGKFWQRADVYDKDRGAWRDLDKSNFKEETFCPQQNGKYSHKHVLWTAQFIEKVLGISSQQDGDDSLIRIAAKHHSPSSFWQHLIQFADHLASGVDREKINKDIKVEDDWGDWRNTPLLSVFETLGCRDDDEGYLYRLPVVSFNIENVFPDLKEKTESSKEEAYQKLWGEFIGEINKLKKGKTNFTDKEGIETLYALLQKYTVNVPSSTQDVPDISLFDHSKTVAAFAVSLYEYVRENKIDEVSALEKMKNDRQTKPFLLFGGDLSGIQKYIYHIKSKHAAKNLKGRSFLLHLITTSVVRKILDETDLYQANVIYNSGGGFFMLLPNTQSVKEKLQRIALETERELLQKFGGKLYLATGQTPFSLHDVFEKNIHQPWRQLFEELNKSKRQRFRQSIEDNYSEFFEPFGNAGNIEKDEITGEALTDFDQSYYEETGLRVNRLTADQARLGSRLKKADYWYIVPSEANVEGYDFEFGGYKHFFEEKEESFFDKWDKSVKIRLNDTDFINPDFRNMQTFEFYGGNDYPSDEEGPKTFEELTAGNYNKLGIIRMDVDNLGYLFQKGFSKQKRTFSRYATLSRNLDLFFKGYINTLWNSKEDYKNHIFILYSGGDDLFVLGDWKIVLDFAVELRETFRRFVCENPVVTLSGGELIVPPKYPILKAAEEAEEPEKKAKAYVYEHEKIRIRTGNEEEKCIEIPKQKDAFAFLDMALGWETEFEAVKNTANVLMKKIQQGNLPKAFLQKIMVYYDRKNEKRTTWLMSYDFGRMAGRYKKEAEFIEGVLLDIQNNTWKGKAHSFAHKSFEMYAVAARWAEFLYRNERKKTEVNQEMLT